MVYSWPPPALSGRKKEGIMNTRKGTPMKDETPPPYEPGEAAKLAAIARFCDEHQVSWATGERLAGAA